MIELVWGKALSVNGPIHEENKKSLRASDTWTPRLALKLYQDFTGMALFRQKSQFRVGRWKTPSLRGFHPILVGRSAGSRTPIYGTGNHCSIHWTTDPFQVAWCYLGVDWSQYLKDSIKGNVSKRGGNLMFLFGLEKQEYFAIGWNGAGAHSLVKRRLAGILQ